MSTPLEKCQPGLPNSSQPHPKNFQPHPKNLNPAPPKIANPYRKNSPPPRNNNNPPEIFQPPPPKKKFLNPPPPKISQPPEIFSTPPPKISQPPLSQPAVLHNLELGVEVAHLDDIVFLLFLVYVICYSTILFFYKFFVYIFLGAIVDSYVNIYSFAFSLIHLKSSNVPTEVSYIRFVSSFFIRMPTPSPPFSSRL